MARLPLVSAWPYLACAVLGGSVALAARLPAQREAAAAARHDARAAQRAFEAYRRLRLPRVAPREGQCEIVIGRLCYWDDNHDPPLPAERLDIAAARERLRAALQRSALRAPTDDWILGQRVRYALEARDAAAARALVAECGGTAWWCDALAGLVWHAEGDEPRAARAFAAALRAMPDSLRCAWLDARAWLPPRAAKRARHASCAERAGLAERLLWLATPLLTWRPEAARNEWFARRAMAALLEGTALPSGLTWGKDVAELALRFGWPTSWAREDEPGRVADPLQLRVVGHEPAPSWSLVPADRAVASPPAAAPDDWVLSGAVAPPMRYAPAGLQRLAPLAVQLARFRRDTAMRLIAIYDASDTLGDSAAAAIPAALVAAGPDSVLASAHGDPGTRRGALVVDAPPQAGLVAVEVVDSARAQAARWRAGLEPLAPDALVSDLLVGRAGDAAAPATLEEALPFAAASLRTPAGDTLLLYWECYAAATPATPVTVTLRLVPRSPGWISRLAHGLGLGHEAAPVALSWTDTGRPDGASGRPLRLGLPAGARGRYRLELVVAGDTLRGRATRELLLTAP